METVRGTPTRRSTALAWLVLMLIIVVGAYLRLANLRTNPAWYPDEGSDLNIARNLLHGRIQYFAISGTLLVAARAPLFDLIVAAMINVFGYDILVARTVAAVAGLTTIPLLYIALRDSFGQWKALAVAAFFAFFPLAVLYNRWAFAYNLLMPLFVAVFWSLLRLMETHQARWMLVASLAVGLSILTEWVSVFLVPCLLLVGWLYYRRGLVWGVPLALFPPALYLFISYLGAPSAFAQDFAMTFSRSGGSLATQFALANLYYQQFIASNYWLSLAIIGLFLIEQPQARALVLLLFFVTLFSILRFSYVGTVGFHRVLALVPFLALGITTLLWRAVPFVANLVSHDLTRVLARAGLASPRWEWLARLSRLMLVPIFVYMTILGVLLTTVVADFLSVSGRFSTSFDQVLADPPADAIAAVQYVNSQVLPDDVVIASPHIAWAVQARAVDFQQVLSYEGYTTDNYPTPIDRTRFVFDPSPEKARFAIVDPMWRVWAVQQVPAIRNIRVTSEWPIAFKAGQFVVYRNPGQ